MQMKNMLNATKRTPRQREAIVARYRKQAHRRPKGYEFTEAGPLKTK